MTLMNKQSYNPGNLKSDLQRHTSGLVRRLIDLILYPAVFGAYTELYAGLSQELTMKGDQGLFIAPWGRRASVRKDLEDEVVKEDGQAAKLFEWCDRVTKEYA